MSEVKIVKSLCRMCDDHCGIDVHVQDGRIVTGTYEGKAVMA